MGCFTVMKSKKKRSEQIIHPKRITPQESTPTVLPEPQNSSRSLQSAPPSFRDRVKPVVPQVNTIVQQVNLVVQQINPVVQQINRVTNSRARALSAPSSLNMAEQDALSAVENDEQEESKNRVGLAKEQHVPSPQPLPLPSPPNPTLLKTMGSFKTGNASSSIVLSGSIVPSSSIIQSGPLPLPPVVGIRNFSYEEVASACHQFSPDRCMSECLSSVIYKASFGDDASGSKKLEATVTRLLPSSQGFKEFVNEVNVLASLQHPHLCKLIGYHAREGYEPRMLVYERLFHGSLDLLLYGRSDGPPIDWYTRMKVALCAAQGLAFLHEEGPFQAMYNEFSTANIQIDKDFSAKLSGYGCASQYPEILDTSPAVANLSVETLERGLLTPKSNVWSFGIVLVELLTGRKNLDNRFPKEERDLVKWSRPFLSDDCRLSLIMDPRLKGRFPAKAARTVADIALRCLQKDSTERPTMRTIVESIKNIQDMKYSCRFPLQEPESIAGKHMSRSPSLNGVMLPAPRLHFPPSPPLKVRSSASLMRRPSMPMLRSRPSCSSIVSVEENDTQEIRTSTSSARRSLGVEGF